MCVFVCVCVYVCVPQTISALRAKLELLEDERMHAAYEAAEAANDARLWCAKCSDLQVMCIHTCIHKNVLYVDIYISDVQVGGEFAYTHASL